MKLCGGQKSSGITSFDLVYFVFARTHNKTLVVCHYPVDISLMDPKVYFAYGSGQS